MTNWETAFCDPLLGGDPGDPMRLRTSAWQRMHDDDDGVGDAAASPKRIIYLRAHQRSSQSNLFCQQVS